MNADGTVVQKTYISRTHDKDESYELLALPEDETKLSLLGNLFLSNGKLKKIRFLGRANKDDLICLRGKRSGFGDQVYSSEWH